MALPADAWATLLAHVRRALAGLDAPDATVRRLQALPARRLRTGRARRELAEVLAAGEQPWFHLARRLAAAKDLPEALRFLVDDDAPRRVDGAVEPDVTADADPQPSAGRDERLDRARDRARRMQAERDEARRQLDGVRVRLEAAQTRVAELDAELAAAHAEVDRLRDEAARADQERQRAVAREQRRQEAALARLQQEVTDLRRAAEEQQLAERDRERAAAAQQAAAREQRAREVEADRARRSGASDLAAPGRPSELPPGVAPGTTAHARALLGPGRRVLVDGYNVAKGVRGDLPDEAARRQWLEQACMTLATNRRIAPEIFWDGEGDAGRGRRRRGGLVVQFSPSGVTADDDIVFAVAAAEPTEPIVVVTDDRGLRARLAEYGVDLLDIRSFGWVLPG